MYIRLTVHGVLNVRLVMRVRCSLRVSVCMRRSTRTNINHRLNVRRIRNMLLSDRNIIVLVRCVSIRKSRHCASCLFRVAFCWIMRSMDEANLCDFVLGRLNE